MIIRGTSRKIKDIITMTKPMQLILLSITMYGAYLASTRLLSLEILLFLTLTAIGAIGGVTALNMYLETDIDSIMERTKNRPLVVKSLSRGEALLGIILLMSIGLLSAIAINKYVALSVLIGLYSDIIMYTEIAKRRTVTNILLGGIAGGMPALGGWAAGRGIFDLAGVLLSAIVMAWIPMHIWFISYYYKEDYVKAGVPMAPTVLSIKNVATLIKISLGLMAGLAWGFLILRGYGFISAIVTSILVLMAIKKVNNWEKRPTKKMAREMFKFASPIIATVFLLLPIDFRLLILKTLVI